jgi:hypothetical protein
VIDWNEVGDTSKYPLPSKEQLVREGMTLDENGKDMSHPGYGKPGPFAGQKRPDYSKTMTGRRGQNWKGGISLDKKAYDAKRWAEGNTSYQRKQNG